MAVSWRSLDGSSDGVEVQDGGREAEIWLCYQNQTEYMKFLSYPFIFYTCYLLYTCYILIKSCSGSECTLERTPVCQSCYEEIHTLKPVQNLHLTQHTWHKFFFLFNWEKPQGGCLEETEIPGENAYMQRAGIQTPHKRDPSPFRTWVFLAVSQQCCTTNRLTVHLSSFFPTSAQIQQNWQVYNKFLNFPGKLICNKSLDHTYQLFSFNENKIELRWCEIFFFFQFRMGHLENFLLGCCEQWA